MKARETFERIYRKLTVIEQLIGLLDWDQQTGMPPLAAEGRGEQAAFLSDTHHAMATSDELGSAIEALRRDGDGLDPAQVAKAAELFDRARRVPPGWGGRFARVTAQAHQAWEVARNDSDFASFLPHLREIVAMRREYAGFFDATRPYDALLADYEPNLTTAAVEALFTPLEAAQKALLGEILAVQKPEKSLPAPFPRAAQLKLAAAARGWLGVSPRRNRIDESQHPFTVTIGYDDVRITTHCPERDLGSLFSTLHETGHAMYELNLDPALRFTPLGMLRSLALHESQSRFWENIVGRSAEWIEFMTPTLRELFPQLSGWTPAELFAAFNHVEPGLIRVDADEVTYNLHIMLRFRLEVALIEGRLEAADLPEAWNAGMRDSLGLEVPDDAHGVLQDVHWAGGSIGYFPTYAIGNLIGAQLLERLDAEYPDLREDFRRGRIERTAEWLAGHIHRHGSRYSAAEIVERATGKPLSHQPYLNYLRGKYLGK